MSQKFAAYDAQRNVTGFYDSEISPAPGDTKTIEITDDQWETLLDGQSQGKRMALDGQMNPVLLDPLPPSQDEIVAMNTAKRDSLLYLASVELAPLQMAVSLGEATDAEAALARALVAFSRKVKAVDRTQLNPTWPAPPGETLPS